MADIDMRAFLGRRAIVGTELILAYADVTHQDPLVVARNYNARLVNDKGGCRMEWVPRAFGWQCSSCGRITRGFEKHRPNFCQECGEMNEGA